MRCTNCGWENTPHQPRCEKCNMPVSGSVASPPSASANPSTDSEIVGTIKGADADKPYWDAENGGQSPIPKSETNSLTCEYCKAPVRQGITRCPYCKKSIDKNEDTQQQKTEETDFKKTIRRRRGADNMKFYLQLVGDEEEASLDKMTYLGHQTELTRENLEPTNNTITSRTQAIIEYIDGDWYLTNKSELKSSFIRVENDEPVKLKKGSVIMFGDREFLFEF